ncbi:MAG: alpha/beta hydrolase [candidate division KSB1 bacterium]|nr:alpha/beta hydrolase [candidate division KSB1 bacterium]MDZ7341632.1 alpha/beta hydrolase [candidate division KSB1 bacterium]
MEFSEISYPFPVKNIILNQNITLAYIDEGSAQETIIFVHGLGSYLKAWVKNMPMLSDHFRCIAIDLPGYGKSSKGLYPFTMEFYADVLAEFIEKLKLTDVTVAGHSMGGQIGMVMALKYPQKVKRLILTSPAGFEQFTDGEKRWFREVMTVEAVKSTPVQQIRANVAANFYNMPPDAEFMTTDRIALRQANDFEKYCYTVVKSVEGMVDQPVYDLLDKISQPTLIIFGENDNLIPNPYLHGGKTKDIGEIGAAKIPNSKLVMIPHCGHFAQFEKAELFNQAVLEFMK